MTYEELGQTTKAKYPQYAQIPDGELGKMIVNKYPVYQSKIQEKGFLEKAGDVLANRSMTMGRQIMGANETSKEVSMADATNKPLQEQAMEIGRQMMTEKDPAKRKVLADQQRQLLSGVQTIDGMAQKEKSLNPYGSDMKNPGLDYAKQGLGVGAEIGSYLLPGVQGFSAAKGASLGAKVAKGALLGGSSGTLLGATDPKNKGYDYVTNPLVQGTVGAGVGALMAYGGSKLGDAWNKFRGKTPTPGTQAPVPQTPDELTNQLQNIDKTPADHIDKMIQRAEAGAKNKEYINRPAVKTYISSLKFPTKLNKQFKPEETASAILDMGIDKSPQEMQRVASEVTGRTGVVTQMRDGAINAIPDEIEMPGLMTKAVKLLKSDPFDAGAKAESELIKAAGHADGQVGKKIGHLGANKASELANSLRDRGFEYIYKGNNPMSPNIAAENLGGHYVALADEIDDVINKAIVKSGTLNQFDDSRLYQYLSQNVSPAYAEIVKKAIQQNNLPALRTSVTPFVRMMKMLEYTNASSHSIFGSLGNTANTLLGAVKSPLGTAVKVAGDLASKPEVSMKVGSMMNKFKPPTLPTFPSAKLPSSVTGLPTIGATNAINSQIDSYRRMVTKK